MLKLTGIFLVLMVISILFTATVYGHEESDVVIISYERALDMALRDLLPIMDVNAQIRGTERQLNELMDDIRDMEQGWWQQDIQNDLWSSLISLDAQLQNAQTVQVQLSQSAEDAFQNILLGFMLITEEDAPLFLAESLQQAIQSMILTQEINNSIAMIEMHRSTVLGNLNSLNNDVRDILAYARDSAAVLEHWIGSLRIWQEQIKSERESMLRGAIAAVMEMSLAIDAAYAEIDLLEENLRRVIARHEFGMASLNDIRTAEHALAQARIDLSSVLINQYSTRQGLNHILGLPLSQNTAIEFERGLVELPENLTAHISELISEATVIRQHQLDVDRARDAKQEYDGDEDANEEFREEYERALLGRDQAKLALEAAIRRGYNYMVNLIAQRNAWYVELEYAALEAALTHLEIGRITTHEVELIRFNIFRIGQSIASIDNQKWILSFLLENPDLL